MQDGDEDEDEDGEMDGDLGEGDMDEMIDGDGVGMLEYDNRYEHGVG